MNGFDFHAEGIYEMGGGGGGGGGTTPMAPLNPVLP